MKKPVIKNWIKYWTTTIAVSGMLALGACDSNEKSTADNIETTTEETVAPVRENVSQEMEAPATEEVVETEASQPQNERTSSNWGASFIGDMDAHIEKYESVNEAVTNELTDFNSGEQSNANYNPGTTNLSNQPEASEYQQNPDMDQQPDVEAEEEEFTPQNNQQDPGMEQQPDTESDQESTTPMNNQQGTNGDEDASMDNQNLQGQDQSVEYNTNSQGTTEMSIQNNDQNVEEGAINNTEGATSNHQGNTIDQDSPSDLYTPEDAQLNQQETTNPTQEQNSLDNQQTPSGVEQRTFDEPQQEGTSGMDQQENIYDNQSNTTMGQDVNAEDPAMIFERHILIYGENLDEESRQRMEEIGTEYNERRESMRGQINDETGAYVSPEVDAQPTVGYEQLIQQIQENITYPQDAVAAEMEGTVYVNFVVDENGNITEAKAYEDVFAPASEKEFATSPLNPTSFSEQEIEELKKEMRNEAVRAVEKTSGMWKAGMQEGQNVKSELQLPVQFKIADSAGGTEIDR